MPYRNRLVRGLAIIALLAGILAGPAGRFLLTARARGLLSTAASHPSREAAVISAIGTAPLGPYVVVISEFRTRGPGGDGDEFIELYNRGSEEMFLSGWRVGVSDSRGSVFELFQFPHDAKLASGQHYLIAGPQYTGAVAPDWTWGSSLSISDEGGIALAGSWSGIMDRVGMSSGSAYLEGTPLPPMTGDLNQSYERRLGGAQDSCQDTGDNSFDFVLTLPAAPQKATSPLSLCGLGMQDTSITLDYDIPDPSVSGQIVNVYYHVASPSGTPAGGSVRVSGSNSFGCQGRLEDGQGGCRLLSGKPGLDSFVASYSGHSIFGPSTSASQPHQVERADSLTRITWDDPDPSFKGRPVVIRVSVSGIRSDVGYPTGTVIVSTGWIFCTVRLNYGVGKCALTFNGVGQKRITALYLGDAGYNPSTSQGELHTVIPPPARTPTLPAERRTPTATPPIPRGTPTGTARPATPTPTARPSPTSGCSGAAAGARSLPSLHGAPLPDLAVVRMGIDQEHSGCFLPGDHWGVRVGIANLGPGRAGRFVVRMDDEEQVVDGMDPYSRAGLFFQHVPGSYNLGFSACVMLDTTGAVRESDETNNTLGGRLPMPSQPPPCIAPSLTPSPVP